MSAEAALAHVAASSSGDPAPPDLRVHLQFHPDRGVVEALARDGVYRSQFETGTGNGGLTAQPGGDRWRWESRLFGGAYDDGPPSARPVYGALDRLRPTPPTDPPQRRRRGAAPRFGSSYLRLTATTLTRTTFCWPDSVLEPTLLAVIGTAGPLLRAADAGGQDPLDDYVEAHVHGGLRLESDVEALVLDPSFRGTPVEAAAARLPCAVEWHDGYRAITADLTPHADFRGPAPLALALSLARDGVLTPAHLGPAVGRTDPQTLTQAWHLLARYG